MRRRDEHGDPRPQGAIAESIGHNQQWMSDVESGRKKQIPLDDLNALAAALGEDPYYILTGRLYRSELSSHLRFLKNLDDADALDERGWYTVERTAQEQANLTAQARVSADDVLNDPVIRARLAELEQERASNLPAREERPPSEQEEPPTRRGRGRGAR